MDTSFSYQAADWQVASSSNEPDQVEEGHQSDSGVDTWSNYMTPWTRGFPHPLRSNTETQSDGNMGIFHTYVPGLYDANGPDDPVPVQSNLIHANQALSDASQSLYSLPEIHNAQLPFTQDIQNGCQTLSAYAQTSSTQDYLSRTWFPMPELLAGPYKDDHLSQQDEQDQQTVLSPTITATANTTLEAGLDIIIGNIRLSGDIKCHDEGCSELSFGRNAELKRHYTTIHAPEKPEFWCKEPLCERSMASGLRPFHRDDKLRDHVNKIHKRRGSVLVKSGRRARGAQM